MPTSSAIRLLWRILRPKHPTLRLTLISVTILCLVTFDDFLYHQLVAGSSSYWLNWL